MGNDDKNYITPEGFERLKSEYHRLLQDERPKVVATVAWAASNGDRSENADYTYGKRRLREIDSRLRFLSGRIDKAEVVDPKTLNGTRVIFGATIEVEDEEGGIKTFQIVGEDEIDATRGRVSWKSPVARALLGKSEGDEAVVKKPQGEESLIIKQVKFI